MVMLGQDVRGSKIPCNTNREFYAGKDYYCQWYNNSSINTVYATLYNTDWNSAASGRADVWLKEEKHGPNPTICNKNNYWLRPGDRMSCSNSFHNSYETFYSNGGYDYLNDPFTSTQSKLD